MPGWAASPLGHGLCVPCASSHDAAGNPGRCRPSCPSKRVNFLAPGRRRYRAELVATHKFCVTPPSAVVTGSSVETPTTGDSRMPSAYPYSTFATGHGPGVPNVMVPAVGPASAGPASVGPASVGPASVGPASAGPASTGPASGGVTTPVFPPPGSATPFAQAAPQSATATVHFPTFPTTPSQPPPAARGPRSFASAGPRGGRPLEASSGILLRGSPGSGE